MRSKKFRGAALILCFGLALTACGSSGGEKPKETGTTVAESTEKAAAKEQKTETADTESSAGDQTGQESDWYFQVGSTKIRIGDPAAEILASLGAAKSTYEAPSCAFDGMDMVYSYPGYEVMTYHQNDEEKISGVVLRDDAVGTPEGIYIGSSKSDAEKVYGKAPEGGNNLKVTKGNCDLLILFTDDAVSSIQYTPKTE